MTVRTKPQLALPLGLRVVPQGTPAKAARIAAASDAPIGGLMDKRFKYVRSVETDISKTFDRIRRELRKGEAK